MEHWICAGKLMRILTLRSWIQGQDRPIHTTWISRSVTLWHKFFFIKRQVLKTKNLEINQILDYIFSFCSWLPESFWERLQDIRESFWIICRLLEGDLVMYSSEKDLLSLSRFSVQSNHVLYGIILWLFFNHEWVVYYMSYMFSHKDFMI